MYIKLYIYMYIKLYIYMCVCVLYINHPMMTVSSMAVWRKKKLFTNNLPTFGLVNSTEELNHSMLHGWWQPIWKILNITNWLVVSNPLKNMKVSWGYYSQYMEK